MISRRNSRALSSVVGAAILVAGLCATGPGNRAAASAPSLTITTPAGAVYDRVPIRYTVQNTPAASFEVKVEYSTTGPAGPYTAATEALGSPSEGTTALAASEAGTSHVFVWNSFYDLNRAELYNTDVIVRVTTIDRATGEAVGSAQTNSFKIDNTVVTVALGQSGAGIPSMGDGGPATDALIIQPRQISLSRDGSVLFTEQLGARVRQFTVGGKISTIVGNGIPTNVAPTTPVPTNGSVNRVPIGVCMDTNGVIFVTQFNGLVATNAVTGSIVVVAGLGAGTDGPALAASFSGPRACIALPPVLGARQVVLVTDNHRIRRFQYVYDATTGNIDSASATLDTICGSTTAGFSPDGTPAKSAQLRGPVGLAHDPNSGKIFVADRGNNVIRAIDLPDPNGAPGSITTIAGNGTVGFSGDGGLATAAQLASPSGVAVNPATGAMYISDELNHRIRQFTIGGIINTVAGDGSVGENGIGGPALQANVSLPQGLVVALDGTVLISVEGTQQVLALTPAGNLTVVAGASPSAVPGAGGQANQSPIVQAFTCTVSGNFLYVSDAALKFIRKVDLSTGIVTRFAGSGVGGGVFTNGMPALDASLDPRGLAVDNEGNVYIPDLANRKVLKIDTQGRITVFAGTGVQGNGGDNGPALQATLTAPLHLQYSNVSGALYISPNVQPGIIRRVDRNGIITTVGGAGTSTDEGVPATQANFAASHMALDPATETIYVSDSARSRVLKFPVGGNVTVIAGVLNTPGFTPDGAVARGALIRNPQGIAVDGRGNVFFAETGNLRVRWIDANGILRTAAGTGQPGLITEGSVPTQSNLFFNRSAFMATDSQGNIYLPDLFYIVRFRPF
ncbi:MAG: hypothetical protein HY650_00940 [Acidobacteria bacterium]|nr:hypothetical protein [Acidobacteriota bacterium]